MEDFFVDPRDGQRYRTVKIGSQTWLAENLNFAADGSCCYDNDESNGAKYGRLYAWESAIKVCPAGWHLPSDEEWTKLVRFVDPDAPELEEWVNNAGTKLKSSSGWDDYKGASGSGTDEYGFAALPGGYYESPLGSFYYAGSCGSWWSATEYDANGAWYRYMLNDNENVDRDDLDKTFLFSVRCVRDE